MQWLIDIVKEWIEAQGYALQSWVQAQGYLTSGFVWRGERTAPNYDFNNLTQDGSWHTLDLSGIIPEGIKAVSLHLKGQGPSVGAALRLRPTGSANAAYTCRLRNQVANIAIATNPTIAVSSDRKIDYQQIGFTFNILTLTVLGWWY